MERKRSRPDVFKLTTAAIHRIKEMMTEHDHAIKGLRVSTKSKGCNGQVYQLDLTEHENPLDEVVKIDDIRIYIDASALMTIIGTEMDYINEKLQPRFVFNNPNEKGRCGCGQSFHV